MLVSFINDVSEYSEGLPNREQVLSPFSESPNLMVDKFHKIFDGLLNAHALIRKRRLEIRLHRGLHQK